MKAETLRRDGSETHFFIDDLSGSSLLTVTNNVGVQNSTSPIHASESRGSREFSIDSISIWALKRVVNSLLHCEFLEWLKEWMNIAPCPDYKKMEPMSGQ